MLRRILLSLLAIHSTVAFVSRTSAQQSTPPSLLEQQKLALELTDQKVDASIREAIADAQKTAKVSLNAATEQLKQAKLVLDTSFISTKKREELIKLVDVSIAGLKQQNNDPQKIETVKVDRKKIEESYKLELEEINKAISEVAKLQDAGKTQEANTLAANIAKKYPNNPAAFSLAEKGSMVDKLAYSREFSKLQSQRILYTFNDIARSSVPLAGDIEFPKDWKEKSKRRLQTEEMSAETQAILKSLETKISTQLQALPFEEAVQSISNSINQPIYLDKKSLEDVPGFDFKKPVNPLAVPNGTPLSARTVLRAMLQSQGLTFVVKENIIQVVTIEKAQTMLATKAYYIGDIVQLSGPFAGVARNGTLLDYQQTEQNVKVMMESIRGYDPMAWRERAGGPATVTFHYPSMSLIVKAPAEVHAVLGEKLGGGK